MALKTIHELFELQVEKTPDATAIVFQNQKITYFELNQKANQLAHHLQELGVKPEVPVALCMERSIEMVISILAVLKAGGAYVRLAPIFPDERLEFILEDTKAPILLTHWEVFLKEEKIFKFIDPSKKFKHYKGLVIEIEDYFKGETTLKENLGKIAKPHHLAYIIYTSGSTGQPKGVLIEHAGVVNVLTSITDILGMRSGDKMAAITTVAFDISVFELLGPLVCGGQVILVPRSVSRDSFELAAFLKKAQPQFMQATPTAWRALIESGWEGSKQLTALCGGEKLDKDLAEELLHKTKNLWNLYGPTEATIWSTISHVEKGKEVNVGYPISRTKVYIVDPNLVRVLSGEEGEILIAGVGIARGYLNRPELTAKSFIENPFTKDPKYHRIYRTGDVGYFLKDGNLQCIGRKDSQVKIRGFRIELGEIEFVLRRNGNVKNCVVIVREDKPGEKRIVAYLTLKKGKSVDVETLRDEVSHHLPDYMIPSAFVFLDHFPLTPNRKIDRKALPPPEIYYHAEPFMAPKNSIENRLAALWSNILGVASVSSKDNFFILGGHSLLGIKLLAHIRDEFLVELPLRAIFDHPTLEGLAAVILDKEKEENKPLQPLVAQDRDRLIPLSFAEQRLWFLDQIIHDPSIYNLPFAVHLKGPLQKYALEKSFQAMIERHEVLRTYFKVVDGIPYQEIAYAVPFVLEEITDLEGEVKKVFDLSQPPLFRACIKTLDENNHLLLIVFHHTISDDWSLEIFSKELSHFYNHFAFQERLDLPKLLIQYADYAIWQRDWLEGEALEKQLAYWKTHLSDFPETLDFPYDRPRPPISSYQGKIYHTLLSTKTLEDLKTLAEKNHATLFMVLIAGLYILLYRYTQQTDLVVGSPIAHRTMKEVERVLGFFVNTLPLRVHVNGKLKFSDFLKHVKETVLQAFAHQDVPFEELVDHLKVTRDLGKHPIFQVMLALENDQTPLKFLGLASEPYKVEIDQAKFDLTFHVKGLEIRLEYATDLLEPASAERLTDHYVFLLSQLSKDLIVDEIPLLTPKESKKILQWNQTSTYYPRNHTIHGLFELQAQKNPNKIALIFENEHLTYEQLNQKANHLSHLLKKEKGPVAVCLDRGLDIIVCFLAILKAGRVYLPLDPNYPEERLKFMLEDSGSSMLISNAGLEPKKENLKISSDLAYVIYTSGTTGRPKGVLIEHASLCDRIQWCQKECPLSENDIFLHLFSFSFDGAVLSTWWPLLSGATLVIPKLLIDSDDLIEQIRKHSVTTVFSTPSILQLIFQEYRGRKLKKTIAGGEKLSKELAIQLQTHAEEVYNFYGPTEATVMATATLVQGHDEPSIGKPIFNTTAYILSESLQPMPLGSIGELYIGGKNLAQGYLNRPELTSSRFIDYRGERVYKTGDLVKFSEDGNLYYMGRKDEQVKLRGYRIELGEIENVLREYPKINDVVVLEFKGNLIAYLAVVEEIDMRSLMHALHTKLPDYMIPSSFLLLKEIPKTPGGKIDKTALLKMEIPKEESISVAMSDTEKKLAEICGRLLDLENVNLNKSFFQIGGHSLLATQVMAMVRKTFKIDLPLRTLFEYPILRDFAQQIDEKQESLQKEPEFPPLIVDVEARYDPFPLTDVQQAYLIGRSGHFELSNVAAHSYTEHDYPHLDIERLEKTWNILIQRHEALRIIFPNESEQQILQSVPYYVIPKGDSQEIREELSSQILPANKWPLFDIRISLLPGATRLHISLDGLNLDAWSVSILFSEWRSLYQNPDIQLPKLELSFRDYVIFQKSLENTSAYARDRDYWLSRIPDFPRSPPLPIRKSPENVIQKFSRETKTLKQWNKLQKVIQEKKLSPAPFLTAVLSVILARWSSTSHFALNLTLFHRLPIHEEINHIMGDFTSLLLLEVDWRQPDTFLAHALRLQQQLWKDLDYNLFTGVAFLRALAHSLKKEGSALMPIVFTCVLHDTGGSVSETVTKEAKLAFSITQTPQVWLDCKALEEGGELILEWDYLEDLFPPGLIQDMHLAYCNLLEQLAVNPKLWEETSFDLLPKAQKEMRKQVNDTAWELPPVLLHELFHTQANIHPESMAVFSATGNLTYGQLQNYSHGLGRKLMGLGAKTNHLVAIFMSKGWEQVAACLGILNAGAAYLPLDPELPLARLDFLLLQTEVEIILTTSNHLDKLTQLSRIYHLICVDQIEDAGSDLLPLLQNPHDLAYVIFTSGSTGLPKGVMIDHQGAVNTILDINDRYHVTKKDRVLALSNLHFDLSVYDIFGLLAAGGAIVIPPETGRRDPKIWIEWMVREKVTLWNTVPMLMQMLVEEEIPPIDLRLVLLSGDLIPLTLPSKIHAAFPTTKIYSLGGATEASIWSIDYPIDHIEKDWKTIPYGKPLRNQQFYIYNDTMEPCPDWVPGHLYIGGMGLAMGYWKDAAQTAKRFIGNLFNTGDLGSYFPDGNIEFLGREDFQVKIRGYRIELGEIEFQLGQIPLVHQAVLDVFKDQQEQKQIVAYVVFKKLQLVQDTGPLAIEETEKLAFKLEQHGIEKIEGPTIFFEQAPFDEDHYYARKSYRTFQSKRIEKEEFEKLLDHSFSVIEMTQRITKKELGSLLKNFRPLTYEDGRLPKYLYPSAGGLYPVQIYIQSDATYYYHPIKHALIRTGDANSSEILIHFRMKKEAITPVYGTLSDNFCKLETGYMQGVLYDQGFASEIHRLPALLIYIKSGAIEGFSGGWYSYPLKLVSTDTSLDQIPGVGEMDSTFYEAAFYIFFLKDPLEAGFFAQRLMEEGIKHSIGFCAIGNLDTYTASRIEQTVVHTLVGGKISYDQIVSREISNPKGKEFFQTYLSETLQKILPNYMVPSYFVFLDKFPLTSNGKVDRRALPSPKIKLPSEEVEETSRNYMEMLLESLWKDVLKVPVSVYDNFFEAGGNSLLMVRLVNLINKSLKETLSIGDFLKNPTISKIARLLTEKVISTPSHILTIQSEGTKTPLFLIHPAGGLALPYLPLAPYFPDQPIYGISNPRFAHTEDPFTSVESMASDYIQRIRSIQPHGPYHIGGWSFGGTICLEMAHQFVTQGEAISHVILIDTYHAPPSYFSEELSRQALQNLLDPYGLKIDSEEGEAISLEMARTQKLLQKYQPYFYEGPTSLIKAKEGTSPFYLTPQQRKFHTSLKDDPFNGLKQYIPHLQSYTVDGEHDLLFSQQYIAGVADALHQALYRK